VRVLSFLFDSHPALPPSLPSLPPSLPPFPQELVGSTESHIIHLPPTKDDPSKRKPDITIAKEVLDWQPKVAVRDGLAKTVEYFRKELEETVSFCEILFICFY